MPGNKSEAGWQKGTTGKLITASRGGPAHDALGYMETLIEYHLPGVNHHEMSDAAFAQKLAHLRYILDEHTEAGDGR